MTANQLAYQQLRSNERIKAAELAEKTRSNLATESQKKAELESSNKWKSVETTQNAVKLGIQAGQAITGSITSGLGSLIGLTRLGGM